MIAFFIQFPHCALLGFTKKKTGNKSANLFYYLAVTRMQYKKKTADGSQNVAQEVNISRVKWPNFLEIILKGHWIFPLDFMQKIKTSLDSTLSVMGSKSQK